MRKRSEVIPSPVPSLPVALPEPPLFVSANGSDAVLPGDFASITERVFVNDALAEYNRLEAALTLGDQRSDYGTLLKALDQAEQNARGAHRLYVTAKVVHQKYELDAEPVQAAMWESAQVALQREKDAGERKKQITDADVRMMASTMFPDEWQSIQLQRAKAKAMVEHVERLAELWMNRCRTLSTMLGTLRK